MTKIFSVPYKLPQASPLQERERERSKTCKLFSKENKISMSLVLLNVKNQAIKFPTIIIDIM